MLDTQQLPAGLLPVTSFRSNSLGFHSSWDFLGNRSANLRKSRPRIGMTDSEVSQSDNELSLLHFFFKQAIQFPLKALKGRDTLGRQVRGRRHRAIGGY